MLKVDNLSFEYSNGFRVLEDISFSVSKGEICGLFGPNGCGKTTLFKCCLRFLKNSSGNIYMNGRDVAGESIRSMAKMVSYVPQEHKPPFPYLVKDVVLMGRTPHISGFFGVSDFHKRKAHEAMELIEVSDLADEPYNRLSGGQRQLVLIARAVAQETPLLFLDEPTSALDFSNQLKVLNILRQIADSGTTIVACTHDPNHVLWFCDSVVVLGKQRFVTKGNPSEIFCDSILDEIYEDVCRVREVESTRMVLPRHVCSS
ncbi:ABC transporter ATP-binding protein [Desulfovibrio sp. JC010]|uniref:ABC transporter ATP-binding protein n=1 Tax=Desulfovibrio sp. JC010 TaxID=2593641 RepID=UPI0013D16EC9|nr:ABC transporter ATP-binding protein [Desulfovibrio sp. JC010]NDV27769.1 ABC transporter ATP-binding protein [Desulfovibrio sp. JC010]